MNIKRPIRNTLIGLTALVASSCYTDFEYKNSENNEYVIRKRIMTRGVEVIVIKKDNITANHLTLIDKNGDGTIDVAVTEIYSGNNYSTKKFGCDYDNSVPILFQQRFDSLIDIYNSGKVDMQGLKPYNKLKNSQN